MSIPVEPIRVHASSHAIRIQCDSLEASGVVLAEGVTCDFKLGRLHVLKGANGVGKSTFLRRIALAVDDACVLFKPEFGLNNELTVQQQLINYLAFIGQSKSTPQALLKEVGLEDWEFERVGTLSSGQRARLAMCVLFTPAYPVWLLDEPMNALDDQGVGVLSRAIHNHVRQGGFVLMASHQSEQALVHACPDLTVTHWRFDRGQVLALPEAASSSASAPACLGFPARCLSGSQLLKSALQRDWQLLNAQPHAYGWGALFHWMVISFFGLAIGKPNIQIAVPLIWISLLLAVLLGVKDWFSDDLRSGWLMWLHNTNPEGVVQGFVARCVLQFGVNWLGLIPVSLMAALQLGVPSSLMPAIVLACTVGLAALVPLLALLSLLTQLTRNGAVLIYILALPLIVPVLVFGLEASIAQEMGRSPLAPLAVLGCLGVLGLLLGSVFSKKLIRLIVE